MPYQPAEPGWWYGADGRWWPPETSPSGGYAQPGYPAPTGYPGYDPYGGGAGYWSDKSKVIAGVLQLVLPFGVGRFYLGYGGIGAAQLVVAILTCGVGALWSYIDGIYLMVAATHDGNGLPLRN